MEKNSSKWINFLRKYGPIPENENMYDETIQRSARKAKIEPILFEHPFREKVFNCLDPLLYRSIILTGTAGDGKTHLCREVWKELGGDEKSWADDNPYLSLSLQNSQQLHLIRDLSSWAPPQGMRWEDNLDKQKLMTTFCESIWSESPTEIFMIAGNDGQLIEALHRMNQSEIVIKTKTIIEQLLVEDRQSVEEISLNLFNLSRGSSAEIFDRAVKAFIGHPGWIECYNLRSEQNSFFGEKCPIRQNLECLGSEIVQKRLHLLFELCDYNNLHLPIRQILLLLTNAVLGHPLARDYLMRADDISSNRIQESNIAKGSIYNNIFGGNLSERKQNSITVFNYFNRFQIGYETNNWTNNILIFGSNDDHMKDKYEMLIEADASFNAARERYMEVEDEEVGSVSDFLQMLVCQRRSLFFKIPLGLEKKLKLWELTVFKYAGEYITDICNVVESRNNVGRHILRRLVKGLNRVFTGMLVDKDRQLYLTTSGSHSQAKISRIYLDVISVIPTKGERISIERCTQTNHILFQVQFSKDNIVPLELNLIRFEFLSRVADEGAIPASFSNECYEDIQAFKSCLITKYDEIHEDEEIYEDDCVELKILNFDKETLEPRIITIKG